MDKKTELYTECCNLLDNIQAHIFEILEAGHGLEKDKFYLLKMASDIIRDFESLSPEVKDAMSEIGDKIAQGLMSPQDAIEMVESVAPKYNKVDNSKKPLLN